MQVLVTGASGHLGFNLCRALVARRGMQLRAAVRDPSDRGRVDPLRKIGVREFAALDVRDERAFEHALRDVDILFHVAASFALVLRDPRQERELLRDSVEGARAAMHAAARAGVRRVVMTSSVVTLPLAAPGAPPVSETQWGGDSDVPYWRAKTQAERLAWALSERLGVELVTVLPGAIVGGGFGRRTPSTDLIESIMLGSMRGGAPDLTFPCVDVGDVAAGHVLAAEAAVSGRFILCNDTQPTLAELSREMHAIDPEVPAAPRILSRRLTRLMPAIDALSARALGAPRTIEPRMARAYARGTYRLSNARARQVLKWAPTVPLRLSLADTMSTIRELRRLEGRRRFV